MAGLSPVMQQYLRIKEENPDAILFFRLGDFYEMFFEDAELVSRELDLVLTGKDCGLEERAPMCGIPYHSCEGYIGRLISKGYKVAICEQTEDPAKAKGLVKREVIRIVTPGTVTESSMLDEGKSNYLVSVFRMKDDCAIVFVDVSTGHLQLSDCCGERINETIISELERISPNEILMNKEAADAVVVSFIQKKLGCCYGVMKEDKFDPDGFTDLVLSHFNAKCPEDLHLQPGSAAIYAVALVLDYLFDTQMTSLANINKIHIFNESEYMSLDLSARRNLELIINTRSGGRRGSLLWVLDRTRTGMGRRMLTGWLERPLLSPLAIERRLNAVEEIHNNAPFCDTLGESLKGISDFERLMTRIVYHSASPKDLLELSRGVKRLPALKASLAECTSDLLHAVYQDIDELQDIAKLVDESIDPEAPALLKDGGVILAGYNEELDRLRADRSGGKDIVLEIERREQERTGIKNLKIKYNKVFGYYIEITNSFKHLTPDDYIRKQTTVNSERYITEELKQLEKRIFGAEDLAIRLEHELYNEIRERLGETMTRVQTTASAIAVLDCIRSLADVAIQRGYTRPDITTDGRIVLKDSRHPVIETISDLPFVPNDCLLDAEDNRCHIITGPNMAGKSTYMRQVALVTIMAQVGSFVPASYASIGVVDAVFTRVGASDDLFTGQSTFMVEMNEVSNILKHATKNSLIILDEIGRGTSTYDGMAIARAVLEHIVSKKIGAKTMFATHYHELTELSDSIDGVKNYNIAVKKRGDTISFLRRIVPGGADRSYGVEVAALAGVPKDVVARAKEILAELEANAGHLPVDSAMQPDAGGQLSFATMPENPVVQRLKELDANTLTPIEALNVLFELSKLSDSL